MASFETLLKIVFESDPTARSPYKLYGCPAMWEVGREGVKVLFARPKRVMAQNPPGPWFEVDGVSYQWQENGNWIGQGHQASVNYFMDAYGHLLEEHLKC